MFIIFGRRLLHWHFLHNFVTLYFMVNLLFKCRKFGLIASFASATSILGRGPLQPMAGNYFRATTKKSRIICLQVSAACVQQLPAIPFYTHKMKIHGNVSNHEYEKFYALVVSNAVHILAINLIKHANKLMYELRHRWMFLVGMPGPAGLWPTRIFMQNSVTFVGTGQTKQILVYGVLRLRNFNL